MRWIGYTVRRLSAWLARPTGPEPREGDALACAAAWFAAGILLWFAAPPPLWGAVAVLAVATVAWWRRGWPVLMAVTMVLAGLAWMGLRIAWQDTPLLPANVGGVRLEGQVESFRPHRPGWARMVLRVRHIEGVRRQWWPRRVRLDVSLKKAETLPLPGDVVRLPAKLLRLPRPQAPGAYDPGRDLYMAGIGAVGYATARTIRITQRCDACGPWLWLSRKVERLRRVIAEKVRAHMNDDHAAALALALMTGERGALPRSVRDDLRAAGLAHILAISGLHLALVAGAIFWLVRAMLAAIPALALRWPLKKIAAAAAWLVALAYLFLSGNSVATQRAFIMLSVALLALLLDRPAISMRNLAVAAWIVLLITPHKAASAGFQMSFLAVAGLVAVYEWHTWQRRHRDKQREKPRHLGQRLLRWPVVFFGGLLLTTLVASIYTALPAAWHFHRLPTHGLLGNLAALPVLSALVMPAGLASLALMPLGLEHWPLRAMEWGLLFMQHAARTIASLPHPWWHVPQMQMAAAAFVGTGLLLLALRRDRWRLMGLFSVLAGVLWPPAPRPDVLVEERARLVAVRTPAGLAATPGRAGDFALRIWLEQDGDGATPRHARKRAGWRCDTLMCQARTGKWTVVYLKDVFGRRRKRHKLDAAQALAKMAAACNDADVVVAAFPLRGMCRGQGRVVIDRFDVWRNGAYALFSHGGDIPRMIHVRASLAGRPWAMPPQPRFRVRLSHSAALSGRY